MRVAVVMAYYKRPHQFLHTLSSIEKSRHADFSVIVVDDASDEELPPLNFNFHTDIISIPKEEKVWTNPEPVYNKGILHALNNLFPDIIMLQNPECMHVGDVIKYASENITDDNYISFGCFSAGRDVPLSSLLDSKTIKDVKRGATFNGDNAWYNHPSYRPVAFDFCSAISVNNIIRLNGYDERFSSGYAFGDNYLIHRIKNLGIKIEITEDPFVIHQWHYDISYPERGELYRRNMNLYNELSTDSNIRAVHVITPDFEGTPH